MISNQLEQIVAQVAQQQGVSPADVRQELMRQHNLTAAQYVALNPREIRGVHPGGGFVGQPG